MAIEIVVVYDTSRWLLFVSIQEEHFLSIFGKSNGEQESFFSLFYHSDEIISEDKCQRVKRFQILMILILK